VVDEDLVRMESIIVEDRKIRVIDELCCSRGWSSLTRYVTLKHNVAVDE
jgi:hypothetical protein